MKDVIFIDKSVQRSRNDLAISAFIYSKFIVFCIFTSIKTLCNVVHYGNYCSLNLIVEAIIPTCSKLSINILDKVPCQLPNH